MGSDRISASRRTPRRIDGQFAEVVLAESGVAALVGDDPADTSRVTPCRRWRRGAGTRCTPSSRGSRSGEYALPVAPGDQVEQRALP